MHRLPEQDIYIYKEPGEEVHKILVADIEGKRLKAFSKVESSNGQISFKIFTEDANRKMETIAEGTGTKEDFEQELKKWHDDLLKPVGESWREVKPKFIADYEPGRTCPKH